MSHVCKTRLFQQTRLIQAQRVSWQSFAPLGCTAGQLTSQRGPMIQNPLSLISLLPFSSETWAEPTCLQANLTWLKHCLHSMFPLLFTCYVFLSATLHWLVLEVKLVGTLKHKYEWISNVQIFFLFVCSPSLNLILLGLNNLLLVVTKERKKTLSP